MGSTGAFVEEGTASLTGGVEATPIVTLTGDGVSIV